MQEGDTLEVQIEKFAHRGRSLTRVDGFVVFIPRAVPGDRMRIRITKSKKSYAEAEPVELLKASDLRTTPRCIYADACGGCDWQHVSYPAQLEMKEQTVREALRFTGHFNVDKVQVHDPIAADQPFYYRNKMTFTFSPQEEPLPGRTNGSDETKAESFLGLHPRGDHEAVLDLHECYLQSPLSARLVNELRDFCRDRDWSAWSPETNSGYLRQLIVRMPAHSSDLMVYLTTTRGMPDRLSELRSFFQDRFPAVTTFVHSVVDPAKKTVKNTRTVFGSGIIREEMSGYRFEIGPRTFFQPNTRQAERLNEIVAEMAAPESDDHVYDLYCGIGALSFVLAPAVGRVTGIEIAPPAVRQAERNAEINEITNCRFIAGDVRQQLSHALQRFGPPDLIVCDPPRAGLDKSVVRQIRRINPNRIVYVSCDPQTQARDLQRLSEQYSLECVQPIDMFPQSYHVENVAKLSAKP